MLVNRISDNYDSISDECFQHLAKTLENKDNKKLFSVVNSEAKAKEIKERLAKNGYNTSVSKNGNMFAVFYSSQQPKIKVTASVMENFSSIGGDLYKALTKVAGVYDYDFDDGSIWRIEKFDDGEYLVKEILSDDENDVVRIKKTASKESMNDDLFKRIMKMFYGEHTDKIISDALNNKSLKNEFENVLNNKIDKEIESALAANKFIVSEKHINNLKAKLFKESNIVSKIDLTNFVRKESVKNTLS